MVWVAGHFGEWVQGLNGSSMEVALITLACPAKGVNVSVTAAPTLQVSDASALMDRAMAAALLAALGQSSHWTIVITPDLPPGGGAGMSTAALVALARAVNASEAHIPGACLATEGAVDPLMLEQPDAVLWAPRSARVLAAIRPPPEAAIVGGFWGPPERTVPNDVNFPPVDDLIEQWALGPDLPTAAHIASTSADRTTTLRGPVDDPTAALAVRLGALGWARSHTGSARALIFPPGCVPTDAAAAMKHAGFTDVLTFTTGGHR